MKTIAIIGQKGGTAKTSLATILSVAAEKAGLMTVAIDLDPQASLSKWSDRRDDDAPSVIDAQPARVQRTLEKAKELGAGLVVIDTAGRAEMAAQEACNAADLVILPTQPTMADLETVRASQNIVKVAGVKASFAVLTRVKSPRAFEEAAEILEGQGVQVCPHQIGERVAYQYAFTAGSTPQEYDPSGKAAQESKLVYEFTHKLLNL